MTRFTDIPSVLMVNTNLLGGMKIQGYEDLLDERLKGKIAMCDPSTSSSASEHLINMLYAMGDGDPEKGWDYVEKFCKNLDGMLLKKLIRGIPGSSRGAIQQGLPLKKAVPVMCQRAPVKLVYMKEGVISTPDVVCIVKGSKHKKEAEEYVDFVTGKAAQTVIADSLDRRSVRKDVEAAAYLPDKEEIHMITADEALVNEKKEAVAEQVCRYFQGGVREMKRERYFQDELWRMFAIYAILPAVLFTFFCGILFYGSSASWEERANRDYLAYVTGRVKQTVESCEQGIETLAELPQAVSGPGYVLERNRIFQIFYGISEQAGYEPELYLVDQEEGCFYRIKRNCPLILTRDRK